MAGMTAFNLSVAYRFAEKLENPPLIVDADMIELQKIESMPNVTSINMNIADFWSRLWANALLLRKPQYFRTHTYEGRLNTPLKGEWDLRDGVVLVTAPAAADSIVVGRSFVLANTHSPYFLRTALGEGWYKQEKIARVIRRWHWSKGDASLVIENPQVSSRTIDLHLLVRSLDRRDLQVWQGGVQRGKVNVGETLGERVVGGIVLPPGETTLWLRSSTQPTAGSKRDARPLGFAVYGIEIEVRPLTAPSS
jgi:hypothetical protein